MLFGGLVVGHVIEVNPAHAVRRPEIRRQKRVKLAYLTSEDARKLIASIQVIKKKPDGTESREQVGLRDRPLIAITIYTFARVGAVLQMNGGDDFVQGRRGWVRLRVSNGALEGMNNTIKLVSHCSFGFRAVENFTAAVYTFNDF
jgi:integrase